MRSRSRILAVSARRDAIVELEARAEEVEDRELLDIPVERVDVVVTNKAYAGRTIMELATEKFARGIYLSRIIRGATSVDIPILQKTDIHRGDILSIMGSRKHTDTVVAAIVGISSGPTFIAGVQQVGFGIFFWGIFVTAVPMLLAPFIGKYIFKFDPAINLGCCWGARTSTASVAMAGEVAKSNVPMLGYTVPYTV